MSPVTFSPPESPVDYGRDDFITVTELGNLIGRDLSSDPGATLAVAYATDACRTIAEQTFTLVPNDPVYLDGTDTDALLLPQLPVVRVRSVKDGADLITDWTLDDKGVLYRTSEENANTTWPAGRQRFTVYYDHGYADVPDDVRMVAMAIASRLVIQGPASFESLGDQQIRYGVNSTDFTNGELAILRRHKPTR